MHRRSRYTLAFSAAFTLMLIGPPFLWGQVGPYPLVRWGDLFDVLTPVVLLPLYWILIWPGSGTKVGRYEAAGFLMIAALWVEGQGMHLSANSIGHMVSADGSPLSTVIHFYDELLSHALWHLGIIGLSALAIATAHRASANANASGTNGQETEWKAILPASVLHGATLFLIFIEGGTTLLGIPYVLLVLAWAGFQGSGALKQQPVLAFFFVSCLLAGAAFTVWAIIWGGMPQFSELGYI